MAGSFAATNARRSPRARKSRHAPYRQTRAITHSVAIIDRRRTFLQGWIGDRARLQRVVGKHRVHRQYVLHELPVGVVVGNVPVGDQQPPPNVATSSDLMMRNAGIDLFCEIERHVPAAGGGDLLELAFVAQVRVAHCERGARLLRRHRPALGGRWPGDWRLR